jgi:DNA-binding MarR family transcriptional regulator
MTANEIHPNYGIENYKLSYRGCIPFYILLDDDLTKKELALYGLIEQMETCAGHAFYNNRTLSKILHVTPESKMVSRMCRNLKKKGYITRVQKEVTIRGKKTLRWVWNTVKQGLVLDEDHLDEGVPEIQEGGVPAVQGGGVPAVHPYNTHDLNPHTQSDEDCELEKTLYSDSEQQRKACMLRKDCMENQKCKDKYEQLPCEAKEDKSFTDVLDECVTHYATQQQPKLVSPQRLISWINRDIKYWKQQKQSTPPKPQEEYDDVSTDWIEG